MMTINDNKVSTPSPIICLMGPTASGKTDLAVELVRQLPCDIISVDSAMVYRGMDIGTAKPDVALLALAPHRLIDIRDPGEPYSAADFCCDALIEIEEIVQRGRIPLLVGGTMLYFRALQQGLSDLPSADPTVRARIENEAHAVGWAVLHQRLQALDPIAAARIHPNDPQRLQRALEVYEITGKTLTEHCDTGLSGALTYPWLNIAVAPEDRALLRQRIAERFMCMLDTGFIDEVKKLYARNDLSPQLSSIRAVGYRQVWAYLAGQVSYTEMVEQAIIASRQLAKRQLTWLRRWPQLHWFEATDPLLAQKVVSFLRGFYKKT